MLWTILIIIAVVIAAILIFAATGKDLPAPQRLPALARLVALREERPGHETDVQRSGHRPRRDLRVGR